MGESVPLRPAPTERDRRPLDSAAVSEEHARLPVPADAAGAELRGGDGQRRQPQPDAHGVLPPAHPVQRVVSRRADRLGNTSNAPRRQGRWQRVLLRGV